MSDINKPHTSEEEYFKRQQLEQRKKWAAEQAAKMAEEEKKRRKELHWMKCPKCGMDLNEIHFYGIKVDRCLHCNGTFFDEGEIQTLLKKNAPDLLGKLMSIFKDAPPISEK